MARGQEKGEMSTPRPSQKKPPVSGSQSKQSSIMGFFKKTPTPGPADSNKKMSLEATPKKTPISTLTKNSFTKSRLRSDLTPQPSSDVPMPSSPVRQEGESYAGKNKENGLLSPATSFGTEANRVSEVAGVAMSSPSRKVGILTPAVLD